MSDQRPRTIVCPSCGNVNPYTADECIKCGLALDPIREAMADAGGSPTGSRPAHRYRRRGGAGVPGGGEGGPALSKPKEPAPSLPELPSRPTTEKIGDYVDRWRFLIRGMGDRAEEIAARFFKQLAGRGIEGVSLSTGRLIIGDGANQDSRDYYFSERDLGDGALATMAVRIAPVGTDLFVEWRHYTTPPHTFGCGLFLVIASIAVVAGIALGVATGGQGGLLIFLSVSILGTAFGSAVAAGAGRAQSLKGFQFQDSTAFQLSVRAALEEAIDLAGISKALFQQLPKEEEEQRRVI